VKRIAFVVSLLLTLYMSGAAHADTTVCPTDPFVALDAAKSTLQEGHLEDARSELAAIPLGGAEKYIDEEVLLQRMLLDAAFLDAANFLYDELGTMKLGSGAYAKWLWGQRDQFAATLSGDMRDYLARTAGGYALGFVRFRLPEVTDQHIEDVALYSDKQVLSAAAQNWDEGRQGLGQGLILAQARVAVVLSAAGFYDMNTPGNLQQVAARLTAGVPVYPAQTMDWIAETCHRLAPAGHDLKALGQQADTRLAYMLVSKPSAQFAARMQARAAQPKAAAAADKQPVKKIRHKRVRRRR